MKKSSHTNKTDAPHRASVLLVWEDITSSAAPQHSYIIYLLIVYQKQMFESIALIKFVVLTFLVLGSFTLTIVPNGDKINTVIHKSVFC